MKNVVTPTELPRFQEEGGRSTCGMLAAVALGGVLVIGALRGELPNPFGFLEDGGESDPVARGSVIYQGHTAESATASFLVEVGSGTAVVAVQALQNHDKPGGWLQGDFQSTNGTSSVSGPDGEGPALLHVSTRYCANGRISTTTETDPATGEVNKKATFDMGTIAVCDATMEFIPANTAAFDQDDTPKDFNGNFQAFVAGAAETSAAAAPCPADELKRFGTDAYQDYARGLIAAELGIPSNNIEVKAPRVASTPASVQQELKGTLEGYANAQGPNGESYPALDVSYLNFDSAAITKSCYRPAGKVSLNTLEELNPQAMLNPQEVPK